MYFCIVEVLPTPVEPKRIKPPKSKLSYSSFENFLFAFKYKITNNLQFTDLRFNENGKTILKK